MGGWVPFQYALLYSVVRLYNSLFPLALTCPITAAALTTQHTFLKLSLAAQRPYADPYQYRRSQTWLPALYQSLAPWLEPALLEPLTVECKIDGGTGMLID